MSLLNLKEVIKVTAIRGRLLLPPDPDAPLCATCGERPAKRTGECADCLTAGIDADKRWDR